MNKTSISLLLLCGVAAPACDLKPMNIGDETDGASDDGGGTEAGDEGGGSHSSTSAGTMGGGEGSSASDDGGMTTSGNPTTSGGMDDGGMTGSTTTTSGGMDDGGMGTCEQTEDFTCTSAVDCMSYDCGSVDSLFDASGCLRTLCSTDEDCSMGETCWTPLSGCAPSVISCSDSPDTGLCECISTDDCGGRICVPTADVPPACGGFAGFECPDASQVCVDDPRDDCDPQNGGADCGGICHPGMPVCKGDEPADPYMLDDARIEGDILVLEVSSSGGCQMHLFAVCWDGSFLESNPVQVHFNVSHESFDDACEAIVHETIHQDLSGLKLAYQSAYQTQNGEIVIHVDGASLNYTF